MASGGERGQKLTAELLIAASTWSVIYQLRSKKRALMQGTCAGAAGAAWRMTIIGTFGISGGVLGLNGPPGVARSEGVLGGFF